MNLAIPYIIILSLIFIYTGVLIVFQLFENYKIFVNSKDAYIDGKRLKRIEIIQFPSYEMLKEKGFEVNRLISKKSKKCIGVTKNAELKNYRYNQQLLRCIICKNDNGIYIDIFSTQRNIYIKLMFIAMFFLIISIVSVIIGGHLFSIFNLIICILFIGIMHKVFKDSNEKYFNKFENEIMSISILSKC